MKLKLAAGFLSLAFFATPLAAQTADQQPVDPNTAQAAPLQLPEELTAILAEKRSLPELSEAELKSRIKIARHFAKDENLPEDVRKQLKEIAQAASAESETRAAAAQPAAEPPKQEAEAAPAPEPKAQKAEPAPAPQAQAPAEIPAPVVALLNDQRALSDLSGDELRVRAKTARRFSKDQNINPDILVQLKAAGDAATAELEQRAKASAELAAQKQAAADQAAAELAAQKKAAADKAAADQAAADKAAADKAAADQAAADKAAANKAAADQTTKDQAAADQAAKTQAAKDMAAKDLAAKDLAAKDQAAKDQVAAQPAPAPAPKLEPKPIEKPAAVIAPAAPAVQAPAPENVQKLDANVGDPAAEQQAKAYLNDKANVAQLSDDQVRTRLDSARELLAANELSLETERAVRAKLKLEREVLRLRLAQAEAAKQAQLQQQAAAAPNAPAVAKPVPPAQPQVGQRPTAPPVAGPTPPPRAQNNGGLGINLSLNIITGLTPPRLVLQDRRPPEQLQVSELQRRIQVYEDAQGDNQYDPSNRDYWRQSVGYDRELLRQRMKEERRRREQALAMSAAQNEIDVQIDPYQRPTRKPRRDVFAAEVNDADMLDVLTAPPVAPVRGLQQRFKVKDIANQQTVRDSVSRIEIDTLRFGYNEGFIREEQLGSLDAIAAIMERIVKKYPNEVFLIEGHTDAVGSDSYNLKLSKLRAESVKRALSLYYVIPARNLRTVGLGERFLKIPTADAEPENRRVSIARITPLLGLGQ